MHHFIFAHHSVLALLVINQPVLAEFIRLAYHHGLYLTRTVSTVEQTRAALQEWAPHFAVVDIDMDDGKILDHLGFTMPTADHPPIIALSRRNDLKTKLAAFEHGVDDILTVPFSPEELAARTLVVLRRAYREIGMFTPVLRLGELEIDILRRRVQVNGEDIHLTLLEQNLLFLLAANAGRVLTRDEIIDHIWGVDYVVESNVVDRHIRNLRVRLQDAWHQPRYIATIPGQGYRFVPTRTGDAFAASLS
jgi:DNA-binding response OmpR family regulator